MDSMAWHYNPVRPSDFFIRADLANHGMPGRFEQLWVQKLGEGQFEICCVPFFTYGVALGDTVQTDDEFTLQRVLFKSGHRTLRVAIVNECRQSDIHEMLHHWVERTGLPYEWYSEGYLAVDLPANDEVKMAISDIFTFSEAGQISFEIDG